MKPNTYKLNTISCSSRYPPQSITPTDLSERKCDKCQQRIFTVSINDEHEIPQQVLQKLHPDQQQLYEKAIIVKNDPNSWILTVPLEINDNEVIYVDMFGDSGADCDGMGRSRIR